MNEYTLFFFVAEGKVEAGECGAIEVVVDAMRHHMPNVWVCGYGCWVLKNVTFNNGNHQITNNSILFGMSQLIEIISCQ